MHTADDRAGGMKDDVRSCGTGPLVGMVLDVHGGNVWEAARRGHPVGEVLDFSANINPLGYPPGAERAIAEHLDSLRYYPDPEYGELTEHLAAHLDVPPKCLLVGNGSVALIHLIPRVFAPSLSLIAVPTFSEYERAVRLAGGEARFLPLQEASGFAVGLERMRPLLPGVDMMWLCQPNNPTGRLIGREVLVGVLAECEERGCVLVLDEVFIELVRNAARATMLEQAVQRRDVIVLRSLTKSFGVPGLRIGYAVAHPATIARLRAAQEPWSVNTLAQAVALAALEAKGFLERSVQTLAAERAFLEEELGKLPGLHVFPSEANYLLLKVVGGAWTASKLCEALLGQRVLVRDASTMRGLTDRFVRVAVRSREENFVLVRALREVLQGC